MFIAGHIYFERKEKKRTPGEETGHNTAEVTSLQIQHRQKGLQ
jgi:hypothetical protein